MSQTESQILASRDEQYVREIARVLHPPESEWKTMVMLEGYFDDSGTHTGSLVTAIGGCVARVGQWAAFAPEWRRLLDDFKVRAYHSADLASSQDDFKGWNDFKKRSFITELAKVMGEYAKTAIAGLVVVNDYSLVPEWARKTPAFGDEYNFCFQMCVGLTMSWIDGLNPAMPEGDQVAFTFDQRPKGEGITRNAYFYIKKFRDPNDRMGTLAFADKKRLLPLQAADFVAYESYKHLDNEILGQAEQCVVHSECWSKRSGSSTPTCSALAIYENCSTTTNKKKVWKAKNLGGRGAGPLSSPRQKSSVRNSSKVL